MAIERVRVQQQEHEITLSRIEDELAADLWERRLAAVELVRGLLRDLPTEKTVERLVEVLGRLAHDSKWEVRRAAIPALIDVDRPAARSFIELLTGDKNRWVRQAAEMGMRNVARKRDKNARFAMESIKGLGDWSEEKFYEAGILLGEKYYEEFIGDTAHELNTYRTAMDGLLQELVARVGDGNSIDPSVSRILDKIRDRSRYLKMLCSSLVEYTKDVVLDFELQPLKPIITDALTLAREKACAFLPDEVEEVLEIQEGIEVEVCRYRLVQALVNILSNAFESLVGKLEGARVQVEVEMSDTGRVLIKITDTGCGMDSVQVESATKRFRSLKKEQGGIGLGLPLALKVIEREHGGRLDIKSNLGAGTTVTVNLPIEARVPAS